VAQRAALLVAGGASHLDDALLLLAAIAERDGELGLDALARLSEASPHSTEALVADLVAAGLVEADGATFRVGPRLRASLREGGRFLADQPDAALRAAL
jgi:DNA-binding IclR family transcriptional regulator